MIYAFFGVNFILQKFCLCKKMTNMRYVLLLHVIPITVYQFVNIIFIKVAMQKISPPFLNMDDEVV